MDIEKVFSETFLSLEHSRQEKALEILQTISVLDVVVNDKVTLIRKKWSNGFISK